MAQIVLAEAGAQLGAHFLPQGISVLGQTIAGQAIGRAVGNIAGRAVDGALAAPIEGARIKALYVMESREGAGITNVYGRMRVGGQVIWASRFTEQRTTRRAGGKGGPKVREYDYTVSIAVALCEGEIKGINRGWANNEPFDLSGVQHRLYRGTETQPVDPLIEMIEGAGQAPAYRGMAYIVFEDLPLEAFGNRLPQLSFEVSRAPKVSAGDGGVRGLAASVTGVNIIPASGEFVYATEIVRERNAPGVERPLNANSGEARADFLVAMDQLEADLPRVDRAALTIGWFGDDMLAGDCQIRPGVETHTRRTVPFSWTVDGVDRGDAYLISRDVNGNANYGGTPADKTVVQAIQDLKRRGIAVTVTPFLFMDTPGFAWRGRIGVSADGAAAARTEIESFVGGSWGYRRFVLHQAHLAAEAGGVEAFLVGSEMRGLTRVRDAGGAYPFVEALISLAAEVKVVLPGAKVSYAADWTEYGAYVPGDGSGDVLFPLDALWASASVDYVGIDWYPPMGDWRDGADHLDALAGYRSADDPDYLAAQIAGGEAYDWYYANQTDRDAQIRTPINDTAHGEHWVFRAKDLSGWVSHAHYERPGGMRAGAPTAWVAGSKPVRLSEIGFSAVDKGGNAPNVFYDPKSVESALPPYSNGTRDDVFQRAALSVTLGAFETDPLVEAAYVWAWDGRPFPAWPLRTDVWGDGGNWAQGHWLNGRAGMAPLGDVVADICARGGVTEIDTRGLDGVVEGLALDGVLPVRAALAPLKAAFGFEVIERDGALVFRMVGEGGDVDVALAETVEGGVTRARGLLDKPPGKLRLTYIEAGGDFQPAVAEARREGADPRVAVDLTMPLAMSAGRADAVAAYLLAQTAEAETAQFGVALSGLALEPGDGVRVDSGPLWRITDIRDEGMVRALSCVGMSAAPARVRAVEIGTAGPPAPVFGGVDLIVMDGAVLPSGLGRAGPLVAAYAAPWPGIVSVKAGGVADDLRERAVLERPAVIGRLVADVGIGPLGRWDRVNAIMLESQGGAFSSASETAVLNGANAVMVETTDGWELVQFQQADLIAPETWRLSVLLRGQQGSVIAAANVGARVVLMDDSVVEAALMPEEIGGALLWQARADEAEALTYEALGTLAWSVVHLRGRWTGAAWQISWVRRGADVAASWTLPEAENVGRFVVETDMGAGFGSAQEVNLPDASVPGAAVAVRVAEIGVDLRHGPWVSIPLNAP